MRAPHFFLLLGVACGSTDTGAPQAESFALGGVRVEVPPGLRSVDENALRERLLSGRPQPDEFRAAARARRGFSVSIQAESIAMVARGGEVAGDFLEGVLLEATVGEGLARTDVTLRPDGEGMEACLNAPFVRGPVETHSCQYAYLDPEGRQFHRLVVACEAAPSERALCETIMASRAYTVDAMPRSTVLARPRSPGLSEVADDHVRWIRFGMSHAEFLRGCESDGQAIAEAPGPLAELARRGELAICGGFGAPLANADVVRIQAEFHPAHGLSVVNFVVAAPASEMSARLRTAYPDFLTRGESTVHYVDRNTVDDTLFGVTVQPLRDARTSQIQLMSGRAIGRGREANP
ncbi:MAG: hypothetical protein AAGE52_18645 [Myxococcota bacterium]